MMTLSYHEICAICDALNGVLDAEEQAMGREIVSGRGRLMAIEIEDAARLHPGYFARWGLSDAAARELATRIAALPEEEARDLQHRVSEFWRRAAEPTDQLIRELWSVEAP